MKIRSSNGRLQTNNIEIYRERVEILHCCFSVCLKTERERTARKLPILHWNWITVKHLCWKFHVQLKLFLFYSVLRLSENLKRSPGHQIWICNKTFPSRPVFSRPGWAGKVHFCPLFDIVFQPLHLSVFLTFFFSLCFEGLFFFLN